MISVIENIATKNQQINHEIHVCRTCYESWKTALGILKI